MIRARPQRRILLVLLGVAFCVLAAVMTVAVSIGARTASAGTLPYLPSTVEAAG